MLFGVFSLKFLFFISSIFAEKGNNIERFSEFSVDFDIQNLNNLIHLRIPHKD